MKAASDEFLSKILDPETESVEWHENNSRSFRDNNAYYYGNILLNGLPSPLSCNISVRGSDNKIMNFHRDAPESSFLGAIPDDKPAVTQSDATIKLRETRNLELIYVKDNINNNNRAVLRYVPKDQDIYYLDAQTGELVKAEETRAYNTSMRNMAAPEEMEMAADDAGGMALKNLNEIELEGVKQLEGVLKSDEIDKMIRSESAYQLDGYILASFSYRQIIKDGANTPTPLRNQEKSQDNNNQVQIICSMNYTKENDNGDMESRYFRIDARTGHVESLSGGSYWDKNRTPAITPDEARKIAEDFLKRWLDEKYIDKFLFYQINNKTGDGAPSYDFNFARKENNYFFPANYCAIQIDCMTGAVCGLSYVIDEDKFRQPG